LLALGRQQDAPYRLFLKQQLRIVPGVVIGRWVKAGRRFWLGDGH
jgi:hypothetical protein